MDEEEFRSLLALGHEQSGVEFKGPGSRADKRFLAEVILAVLGMSNHRDGGRIFIGVAEDKSKALSPAGLSEAQDATWTYDDFAASVEEYADPSVSVHLEHFTFDGHRVIAITVGEFNDIPILCKKSYMATVVEKGKPTQREILRKGACYVRPRRKPETTEIPTQADMRDLLDLAIEKRLRRYVSIGIKAGLFGGAEAPPTDADRFNTQIADFLG